MNTIETLLKDIRPETDFAASADFFADGVLDSFDLVMLVSHLEKTFHISIAGTEIVPENFRNIDAIQRLLDSYRKP